MGARNREQSPLKGPQAIGFTAEISEPWNPGNGQAIGLEGSRSWREAPVQWPRSGIELNCQPFLNCPALLSPLMIRTKSGPMVLSGWYLTQVGIRLPHSSW